MSTPTQPWGLDDTAEGVSELLALALTASVTAPAGEHPPSITP
ncbi:MAG TPA: hypothetical protein PLZ93_18550 [Nocardioides sp.]|nr:hypothetical protein [uncultured Nocardioides sp.]HRD63891.1 hypothetical protein [Nocardioides sp.]HRI97627.1 hypothetical protein [Nocardioides sp.]HRK47890.1 hypothetical protein [Nocardioides sp.]